MFNHIFSFGFSLLLILLLVSCKAFYHGYTWKEAKDKYHLITGKKEGFGDRRLDYNKGFHKRSALSSFLDCNCNDRGLPDFIFEYQNESKCRGIQLFYTKKDSVFIFEEPAKGKLQSIMVLARPMNQSERNIYISLKANEPK